MVNFLTIKKLIVTGVLAVTGVVATEVTGLNAPVSAATCTNGSSYKDFDGSYSGRDTMTVSTKGNVKLCKDVNVNFTTYKVHNKYNGQGFKNNPTALPQSSVFNKTVTLKKGTNGMTTVKVSVPDACTDYQMDAYIGPVQTKITTSAGLLNTNAIVGKLFQRTKSVCTVEVCDPTTGKVITVDESKQSAYKPVGDVACTDKQVCDPSTGKTITVKPSEVGNYKPINDAACVTTPVTPETPVTPVTPTPEAPVVELPKTGSTETFMSIFGASVLTGSATAFVRSRR